MRRNFSELEQRLVVILKKNSRMSVIDIAKELDISRITAKKILDSLVNTGRIKKFTVTLEDEEKDMVLVYTDDISKIPENLMVECFRLIDNSYIAVLFYEDLVKIKDTNIKRVEVAVSRSINENLTRMGGIHCDYCQSEIKENPIVLEISGKSYYACCPNCERDLKKRRELMVDE